VLCTARMLHVVLYGYNSINCGVQTGALYRVLNVCVCVCLCVCVCVCVYIYIYIYIHRVSQEECARLREGVPYGKVYPYNPKHLYPKVNGYGDNGQRKVWSSCGSTYCTC
jgi:hypothetical protein